MLFNTFSFWVFFSILLIILPFCRHRASNIVLLAASYFFYSCWDVRFCGLIALSTVVDFFLAQRIERASDAKQKKFLLCCSLGTNLGLLGIFKYYNFFVSEFAALLQLGGVTSFIPTLEIILPVGISFYTFQTISYSVDVYRGEVKATNNFIDFALYVAFFPQLVAGPIERSSRLLPQVSKPRSVRQEEVFRGLFEILQGLFMKVIIADNMAPIADYVFSRPFDELSASTVWIGLYAFAFQIYGDFSGYSSIAQGVARLMGFDLMNNFRMPYLSSNPSEFWRRWHISLSSFLRDYLYIPLGGNRLGEIFTYRNLIITMALGGLWHGAESKFIYWGLFHGALLVVYKICSEWSVLKSVSNKKLLSPLAIVLYFHLTCLSWLLFRAESSAQIWAMLKALLSFKGIDNFAIFSFSTFAFYLIPMMVFELWSNKQDSKYALLNRSSTAQVLIYAYLIFMLVIFSPPVDQVFIYFQF